MCGISGIYNFNKEKIDPSLIKKINDTLIHRGPDADKTIVYNHIALGHRRLSIIDLSESANQPMFSEDDRYAIVFNGEVYNFQEIKLELQRKGIHFNTHSDTEVVLKAYMHWGKESISKLNGMFAFAILDTISGELTLARDQFGVKPLYFYKDEKRFIFASEKKAILAHPKVRTTLNNQALTEFLWYGNPLGENTFYNEIKELNPGNYLSIQNGELSVSEFYNVNQTSEIDIKEADAIEEIRRLLNASVERHLISDVPVGVFLSGGIDSSAITAIASKFYKDKLKTYSVGFDFAKGPNELQKAASIAKKFGTDHNEVHIGGTNIIDTIEALVKAHDEPFGDAADIPLYLLTKEIKGQIKVVLQGDGGDEFFGGYSRYHTLAKKGRYKLLKGIIPLLGLVGGSNTDVLRARRFITAIAEKEPAIRNALLLTMESDISNPSRILSNSYKEKLFDTDPFRQYIKVYNAFLENIDETQALFYTDTQIILKDTFFEKVDKSTMANSIEVRVPFIDKDLTEFMLSIPAPLKVKNGEQKYLLKKALNGIVPNDILYGKKTGFSVPYEYWLQSSLKDYFIAQVNTNKVKEVIDIAEVTRMNKLHQEGKGNFGFLLWKTLILAVWLNQNKGTL